MAKKEGGFSLGGMLKSGILSDVFGYIVDFPGRVRDFILSTEEKVIQMFYSATLLISGLIFLSIAFVFLMNEYLVLSKGWSFLVVGLVLVIASLVIKGRMRDSMEKRR